MMKVFLSWSGEQSHKVALVFKEWLPSVIQSLDPYVSSENIDKGARWSTDIAQELEDSTFGILCVTKDNIDAPWLTFEAGALSKTMEKAFVCPFLFNVKRSEVDGPILQFQSTIFEKDDIKKLLRTLNKACGDDRLTDEKLNKAFGVWYPTLNDELSKIKNLKIKKDQIAPSDSLSSNEILEEVLEISRINQKLLRNPEMPHLSDISRISDMLEEMQRDIRLRGFRGGFAKRSRINPSLFEDIGHVTGRNGNSYVGLQVVLGLLKHDYPWIYDAGIDFVKTLRGKSSKIAKEQSADTLIDLIEFTFEHPSMHEMNRSRKDIHYIGHELGRLVNEIATHQLSKR